MLRACLQFIIFSTLTISCTHASDNSGEAVPTVDELGIVDPEPGRDNGPAFCNPSGRQGEDLRRCNQQNEDIYKVFTDEAKNREPWFSFPGDSWLDSKEVESKYIASVIDEKNAVTRLDATPVIELSNDELRKLTGKAEPIAGRKPYLVRALLYYKDTGTFAVFEKGQEIFVRHSSVGSMTQKEIRSALVVYLPFKPTSVFIDCQISE